MADISKVYDEAVKNGLLDPAVSQDEFKNIMGNAQMRKAYFDFVQEHKRGFYGDDYAKFSSAAERMVGGSPAPAAGGATPATPAMPTIPAAGGNPRVSDYPAPTNAAEEEANRINQNFGSENNLQIGVIENTQRPLEQYSAEGLETRRKQILDAAERKKQQRIQKQEQWEQEHPFMAALSGMSHGSAMPAPSAKEALMETPTDMFTGKQQGQLRAIEDELGQRAGELYIPQAKESIKQSEEFVAKVRANNKDLSARQKANLGSADYLLTKANEIANAGSKFDDSKAMANWLEGLKNDLFDRDIVAGWGLQRDIRVNDIVEKVNQGEELTDDEAALLNAYFTLATATEARQFDLSTGYQIGQGTAQSVPFMIDMFVSRGAGAAAKHGLLKALTKAGFKDVARVERWLQVADKAGEAGKMGTRDIARKASYEGIATPLQTALMPSSWRQMQQEATQMRLERGENDLSLLDKTRIFTNATKETLTERVGGDVIDWGLGRVFGKITQPWRLGGKGQFAVNKYIQSPIGETGEEYIGALIDLARSYNPLYDDESNQQLRDGAEEMFSWEGFGKTFGTVLPMSILGGAANMAELRYKTGKMEKAREDISSRLQQAVGMSEEDARQIMAYTESAGTAEEFADRLDIVGRNIANAYEDMGADVETKGKDGKTSGVIGGLQQELNEYATQAAGVNKIVEQFSAEYDKLSDEEKQNAKQLLEQARKENRDRNFLIAAGNMAIQEVNGVKNRSNNYLYNVSFADGSLQEGDAAYVVGGNMAVRHDDEGKVLFDKAASEDDVVEVRIVHADGTSEVKQVSVGELDLLQEPITAEEYLNERTSMLYGEMVAAAESESKEQEGAETIPAGGTDAQPQQEVVSVVGYTTDNNGGRVAQLSTPININGTITTIVPESMLDEIMTGEGYTKTEDGAWARETAQQPKPVEQEQPQPVEPEQPQPKAEPQQPQSAEQQQPQAEQQPQENVPFAENLAAAPRNEQGKVDYARIEDTEELARVVTAEMEGDKEAAKDFITMKKKAAENALKKLKHKDDEDSAAFLSIRKQEKELRGEVNRWNTAITALNSIRTAEEQTAYEAEQARMQAEREARKQTETASKGDGTMAARYAAAQKIDGNTGTITAANGQVLKGHYVLVSADGLTPSHDARNGFNMSEGYPTVDGKSINDRDYKNDPEEQAKVKQIAQQYNGNAIKNMPIVSDEGLVYNGNGRTMAGQLAAQQGTDGAYRHALTDNAAQFGFTAEQVASVPNARVVFQTDERLPYNTTTLALFNATEQQTQSNTAKAAANTRKLTPEAVGHIIDAISGFDNTDAFFSHKKAPFDLINTLIADGVLTDRDKASLIDGDRLSGAGKDMLMGVLFGTAFDEKTIRLLADNAQVQNSVMRALPQILENKGLGEYSLFDHINNAIAAIYDMRENGMSFYEFTRQTDIFGKTASDRYTAFEILLAEEMMKKDEDSKKGEKSGVAAFREVLTLYNERAKQLAGGQADIFGELTPREDIENAIVEYYKNKRNGQDKKQPGQSSTPKQPSDRQGGGETEHAVAGAQGGDGRGRGNAQDEGDNGGRQQNNLEEKYKLSDEIDENGRQFVLNSKGELSFGRINGESGLTEAPILLSEGIITNPITNDGYGLVHIEARHGEQIRKAGYSSVLDFIEEVAQNYDVIRIGNIRDGRQTYRLQLTDKHNNTLMVELSGDGAYWNINTAGIFKKTYGANNKEIYNRHTTAKQPTETAEASRANEQSGTQLTPSMNASISEISAGKGSEKSANDQTNSQKNAEKVENASENGGKADGKEQKEVFGSVDELDGAVSHILATYPSQSVHALVMRLLSQNGSLADDWMWEHQITTQSELGEWCKLAEEYDKAKNAFHNKEDEEEKWKKEYLEKHYPNYSKDGVETEDGKSEYKRLKEDSEYQQVKNNFDEEIEKLSVLYDKSGSAFREYEAELKYKHVTDFVDAIRKKYQPMARAIFGLKANEDVTQEVIDKATDEQRKEYDKIIKSYKKETKVFNREKYLDLMQSERKNEGTAKKKSERGVRKQRVPGVSRAATKTQVSAIVEQLQKAMPGTSVHTAKTTEQAMDYIAKRKQKAQEQEVERVNNQFNAELQQQIDGTLPKGHIYQLGMPSEILRSAGIPSLPIELAASRLLNKSNQENHPFNISEMNGLVNAIQKPIAVFHSATHVGDFVILTNIKHNGKNFVAAIKVNKEKGKVLVNDIRSIHPRTTTNVTTWINEGLMSYADKIGLSDWLDEKIKMRDYLNSSDPAEVRRSLISAAKVVKSFENPKLLDEKDKIAGVFAHFQRVFHGSGANFDVFDSSHIGEGEGNQSYGYGMYVTEVKEVARSYAGTNGRRGIIYKVTIPDNNGSNYLQRNEFLYNQENKKIANALYEHLISTDDDGAYENEQAKQSLREELEHIFSGNVPGDYAYANVSSYLGSDAAASKFLHSLGYVGIVYPTNSMSGGNTEGKNNYVIFDDSDLRIDGKERFELDEQGDVAGATMDDGTVLLVEDHMRIDTPFHEFAHKLYEYAKSSDSHLLDAINKYIAQAPKAVKDYVAQHYPNTISTDAYLDEVFAWALSNQSEGNLRAFLRERGLDDKAMAGDVAKVQSWYSRLWKAVQQLWGKVKSAFAKDNGKQYADLSVFDAYQTMSVEEIGNRLYDTLMGGKELPGTSNTSEAQYDELDYDSDNLTDAQQLATDAVILALDNAGIETEVVSDEEANAEVEKQQSDSSVRLMLQIMEQGTKGQSNYPIAGAKLQKNLQTTKEKYKNFGIATENAITDIAKSLGARNTGTSNYITIEAKNGNVFTLRISNHNATVSNFDNNGENNGISIVISRHGNDGITNNGNAHIIEFFYSDKALNKAEGTPIADIIGALEQTLYSGEYTDPTGLAQVQEVNIPAELLKNHSGKVYGYAKGGKIYLTENGINPNTPIHEYAHLWAKAMRRNNPQGWKSVVERLKGTPIWDEVVNDPNYQALTDDNAIASEVLARYSGKRGAERMENTARQLIDHAETRGEVANAISLIQRVKKALQDFWKWVGTNLFDIQSFGSAEEIADRVLYDLLNGTDIRQREQKNTRAEFLVRQYVNQYAEPSDFTEDGKVRHDVLEEIRLEREEIERKAKADGTWMKAPNGKPTKLTQEQWVTVRTKRFKNWFGDWELATKNIEVIEAAAEHGFKSFEEARAWAKSHIARTLTNEETGGKGEIRISHKAINKFLSDSAVSKSESKDVHLSVLKVLPDVIHNSIDAEQHPDYLKGEDGKRSAENGVNTDVMIHHLYGAVEIDGKLYRVKVTLKEYADVNETTKAYSYEATKIELLAGTLADTKRTDPSTNNSTNELFAGTLVGGNSSNPSTNNSISGAKLLKNVESSKQSGKKLLDFSQVVDENGEPMVVRHTSTNQFTVFRRGVTPGLSGKGIYFAISEKGVPMYGRNVYYAFLNVRNPLTYALVRTDKYKSINNDGRDRIDEDVYSHYPEFDGVMVRDDEITVKDPNQIKSATANVGTFSSENDDIRFSIVGTGNTQNEDGSIRPDETLGEYARRVAHAHKQKKLEDAFKRAHLASSMTPNDTKAAKQKADAIYEYLSFTFGDEYPLQVVPTTDNLAEQLQGLGVDEVLAKEAEKTINTFIRAKGFMLNGTIFVLSNRVGSISQAENVYIHERQHVDNAEYDLTEPLIEHISAEEAVDMLRMLKPIAYKAYADMYLGKGIAGHRMLLDELIAYAVSESMQFSPSNPVQYLQKKGITNKQLLNIVENECRRHRFGQLNAGAASRDGRVRAQGERRGRASSDMRPANTVGRNTTQGISYNLNGYVPLNISEAPTPASSETRGDYAARFKMWYDQQRTLDAELAYAKAQKEARTKTENVLQHVADRYRPLQKFQEYILAKGGSIRPSEQDADGNLVRTSADAYQDTTLATGRAGYQMQRFASHQLQDMADAIADILNSHALDGIDIRWNNIDTLFADMKDRKNGKPLTPRELIGIYAQAKDCQEAIEQGLPDRGAAGFEKNLQDQDSNPISHQEVIRMVESAVPAEKIKTLWDTIHAATQFSLDYQLAKGMIDQETHDRYTRRYYVPERGWRERDLDGRTDAYVEGRDAQLKGNPYNPALKKAHGRESIASDPFAYIQSIAETTIMSAERNSVKQKFLQLLLDNQEIGMKSGAWQIRRAYVVQTTDPAGVEQQVVTYEKPTREEDIITTIVPESMIEQRTRDERLQHRVMVMRDGQQYIIELQDEALANALNSNFQEAKWLSNSVANMARTGVRYMSAINTQYNPAFAIWNLYRDLQIGLINNIAKEDKAFTARFIKNIAAVQPVIMRYVASDRFKGEENFGNDKELSKYLQEYFESGAQTGFSYMRDINTLGKEFDKLLQAQSMSKKAGKAALGALSIATELSELTVRFAEFATARQMGFTTEEAAAKAKEISVNFDRKGLLGGTFSGLYSFFNATIQGGWNILRSMKNKRARRAYLATAALYMAAGVLNTLLNPDDPDDEVFFSEYDRQTNFLFGKIKLPVTHFFRMFFAAGVNITLFAQNKKTGKKTAQDIVKFTLDEVVPASIMQVHNAWGYNPSTNEYEWDWTQYIQQSAPSVISPIVDVALNRDFKGSTVHREPFLSSEKGKVKNVAMEKRNTPSIYHDIAYGLHRLSGGNPDIKTRGYRTDGWIDINPNDLQHLVEGYFGGSGGFFGDLYSTAANAFRGEFDPSTVPVLNRAFRPYQQERSYTQQYWILKNRVDAYDKWLEDTKKNDRQTYQTETQSELYKTYQNANKTLNGMKKPSDELPYSEKETKDKTQQLMQLNVEWNKAQ